MSEEKASDFRAEPAGNGTKRIANIGHDPWLVKEITGTVRLTRPDAARLKVTPLDHSGYPTKPAGSATEIKLDPATMYYLISQ